MISRRIMRWLLGRRVRVGGEEVEGVAGRVAVANGRSAHATPDLYRYTFLSVLTLSLSQPQHHTGETKLLTIHSSL